MNRRQLPFSFTWMGLVLTIAFLVCGWLQLSSRLVAAGALMGVATVVYTLLAARSRRGLE